MGIPRAAEVLRNRSPEALRIAFQEGHDLIARHEAVGVVAVVCGAWKLDGPIGCHKAEGVPPVPPCLTDPATLKHRMLDPRTRQLMAQAEPCLSAANDHHVDALHSATKGTPIEGRAGWRAAARQRA